MPTEPHNKPHSVATDLDVIDLGYASLYSRWGELYIYLVPIGLVISALFAFLAFKAGASVTMSLGVVAISLVVLKAAARIAFLLHPLYQTQKLAETLPGAKTTAHIFTAAGVELRSVDGTALLPWSSISKVVETKKGFLFFRGGKLATFLPARCLEGPIEAELIRKFVRRDVADVTLRA
jgi:hypothetical protein